MTQSKVTAIAASAILLMLFSAGCISGPMGGNEGDKGHETTPHPLVDTDGDGLPDSEDPHPNATEWRPLLYYLDDTYDPDKGAYAVDVCTPVDYGVCVVKNAGEVGDTIMLSLSVRGEGWDVALDTESVALDAGEVAAVTLTITPPKDISVGDGAWCSVMATSKGNGAFGYAINLTFQVSHTGTKVSSRGDKVVVYYELYDDNGTNLDSGTLPATAGEKYVGPGEQLGYIEGFYMGLLGMYQSEKKWIAVPPELGYGTDPNAHELGGEWLYFYLDLKMLI